MNWKTAASALRKIAPSAATALGGPAGGLAATVIAGALGVDRTPQAVIEAVKADPQAALKLAEISADLEKAAMLDTADATLQRGGLLGRARLAEADATSFDSKRLFGYRAFDRVFISYSLSMIPDWRGAIRAGLRATANGGELHIVDFGRQERLPRWFRNALRSWLARFHVTPRDDLREVLESECQAIGASLEFDSIFRGYAVIARIRKAR